MVSVKAQLLINSPLQLGVNEQLGNQLNLWP